MRARDSTRFSILANIFKEAEMTLSRGTSFFGNIFYMSANPNFRVEMIFISQERKRQMKSSIEAA
jgi:hypothetical protein